MLFPQFSELLLKLANAMMSSAKLVSIGIHEALSLRGILLVGKTIFLGLSGLSTVTSAQRVNDHDLSRNPLVVERARTHRSGCHTYNPFIETPRIHRRVPCIRTSRARIAVRVWRGRHSSCSSDANSFVKRYPWRLKTPTGRPVGKLTHVCLVFRGEGLSLASIRDNGIINGSRHREWRSHHAPVAFGVFPAR